MKTYQKFLSQNKLYTFVSIVGFAISLLFVILITVYTYQELSTDNFQKKADRIYLLGSEKGTGTAYRLADRIAERYPEVEKVCPMAVWGDVILKCQSNNIKASLLFVDTSFLGVFSFPLLEGDPSKAFANKGDVLISESFARKQFGNTNPIGQQIEMGYDLDAEKPLMATISGIIKDIKNSVIPNQDILVRIDNIGSFNPSMDSPTFNNAGSALIFILAKPNANLQAKTDDMASYFKEIFWIYKNGLSTKVVLTPLHDVYFGDPGSSLHQGSLSFVMLLISIGFAILLFAVINYINLTVAQTSFRAKEMAIRRLLGSSRKDLLIRLLSESVCMSFVSFILGLLLAILCAPYADRLLETRLNFAQLFTPFNSILTITAVLVLGIISGVIPALMISRFNPIDVVKGTFRQQNKLVLNKLFIITQNVITIVLIVAAVVMWNQTQHLITAPLGYNTDNKIAIDTEIDKSLLDNFVSEVRQLACVKQIGFSQGTPFSRGNNNTASADGRTISFQIITADSAFINMYDLKVLNNNHSDQAGAVFLSEQAMKELEVDANVTEFKFGNYARPVAGSIKDFRLHNVMRPFEATLVCIQKTPFYPWHTTIEIQGDQDLAFQQVASVYKKVTGIDFAGKYVDQEIAESFAAQNRMSKIVLLFSAIAVLISLMGLLAMSTYFIQQQSKNIALRKVMGATNTEVLVLLVGTFLIYVGVAFVIATPIAWYVMRNWLSDYSYRIELTPSLLLSGGLFCFVVSFVTVYWQSWRAAIANPVERIKSE